MSGPVTVERPVFEAIEEVRQEGRFNMLNYRGVKNELAHKATRGGREPAEVAQYHAAVAWMDEHEDEYARAIFEGLEPEPESEQAVVCDRCGEPVEHADNAPARCEDCFESAQREGRR
jgi:formylmethanofuran dehydrogenase subunit E